MTSMTSKCRWPRPFAVAALALALAPAVAAAPQAESRPAAQKPAVDPASAFARFVPIGDDEGRFEVAITTYRNKAGAEVSLIAAVHIADAAHYADLQRDFKRYDALLYELVADASVRPDPKSSRRRSPGIIGMLQTGMKNALGLEFQLHAVDYTPDNFVHADLTPESFKEKMDEKGETFFQVFLRLMSKEMARQRELREQEDGDDKPTRQPSAVDLISAFQRKEGRHLLRLTFATQLQNVEAIAAGAGEKGTVLLEGLRSLRSLTIERDAARLAERMMPDYADLVYTGRWFHPARRALDAMFKELTTQVTGAVKIELWRGRATPLAIDADQSLYSEDLATFGASMGFQQKDSEGFIRIYGLPGRVAAAVHGGEG